MPIIHDGGFFYYIVYYFDKKAQSYLLKRVPNIPPQLHLFHALSLKKHEHKPYQYQPLQRFFSEYIYEKHIDSLQLSQKQTKLKIHSLTKNLFGLKIFAMYLPLKLIFFTVHMSFFD